ncbi:MAG: hypothetical protein J0I41_17380 [Filimonas sp.]|nr:hypothetical protein [Filimonas sp.]
MKPLIMVIVLAGIAMSVFRKHICQKGLSVTRQVRKIKKLIPAQQDSQPSRHSIFFKEIW